MAPRLVLPDGRTISVRSVLRLLNRNSLAALNNLDNDERAAVLQRLVDNGHIQVPAPPRPPFDHLDVISRICVSPFGQAVGMALLGWGACYMAHVVLNPPPVQLESLLARPRYEDGTELNATLLDGINATTRGLGGRSDFFLHRASDGMMMAEEGLRVLAVALHTKYHSRPVSGAAREQMANFNAALRHTSRADWKLRSFDGNLSRTLLSGARALESTVQQLLYIAALPSAVLLPARRGPVRLWLEKIGVAAKPDPPEAVRVQYAWADACRCSTRLIDLSSAAMGAANSAISDMAPVQRLPARRAVHAVGAAAAPPGHERDAVAPDRRLLPRRRAVEPAPAQPLAQLDAPAGALDRQHARRRVPADAGRAAALLARGDGQAAQARTPSWALPTSTSATPTTSWSPPSTQCVSSAFPAAPRLPPPPPSPFRRPTSLPSSAPSGPNASVD